jgi:hypothetical protein
MFGSGSSGRMRKLIEQSISNAQFINDKVKVHKDIPAAEVYELYQNSNDLMAKLQALLKADIAIEQAIKNVDSIIE